MEARNGVTEHAGAWMRANLTTQGYCLTDDERRELAVGLRFSTALCLSLVLVTATNLCLPSEALAWWERRTSAKEPVTT
jgi:hypothetical protein